MNITEINEGLVFSILKPRGDDINKGRAGTLSLFCGSRLYRGAAALAAEGALRTGVGILRLVTTECVIPAVLCRLPEAVYSPLTESPRGGASRESYQVIFDAAFHSTAFAMGPGLGQSEDVSDIVLRLCGEADTPMLIDADALNCIAAKGTYVIDGIMKTPILTPHVGEFARLSGLSVTEIKENPAPVAAGFARKHKCVLVLKDSVTYIASPDGKLFVNGVMNSGLARGGSGDVLSGIVSSLLAQGYSPLDSAVCGVYLHSAAAKMCAARLSKQAMLPHDIFTDLSAIFLSHGY